MKRFIILLAAALSFPVGAAHAAADIDALWESANTAYSNADYTTAIRDYGVILDEGYTSHKLYYNLGNAYFKDKQMGKAILFYNRALLLKPSDRDTKYNLEIANGYTRDRIEPVPEFFLTRWVRSLRSVMGSNGWAAASLILLAVMLGAALLYLLPGKTGLRKTGFYTAICSFALFVTALGFSIVERHEILHSPEAIVMSSAVSVKSSPDKASTDLFILHEGTKVRIVSSLGEWREVEVANGNKGWIADASIERIR